MGQHKVAKAIKEKHVIKFQKSDSPKSQKLTLIINVLRSLPRPYGMVLNWLNKFFRLIYASVRSGDKDSWTYHHNLPDSQKNDGWVFVRDHEKAIIYYGAVIGWSENQDGNKELVLTDAKVYGEKENNKVEYLYDSRIIYLNKNLNIYPSKSQT